MSPPLAQLSVEQLCLEFFLLVRYSFICSCIHLFNKLLTEKRYVGTQAQTSRITINQNGKGPDAGKYNGQEEKRATEDEMVGWHH